MADGTLIFNTKLDNTGLKSGMTQAETSSTGLVAAFTKSAVAANLITEAAKAAAQAVVEFTKQAVEMSAAYEQNIGGIETLFKESAATVIKDAEQAYMTAGVSANEYMENVTSFAASLISSLGGNTREAAKLANTAMVDMSDNANKMGTSMESITNAYQGFAKQNYTMLDNLKLGYGGTKEEMQRLLDKANEINAQQGKATQYSISSFSDIVQAIHVVQNELGITGTTAKEATETITGSINAAKAAWENFLVGVTSPEETANAFATALENIVLGEYGLTSLFPRLMEGLGELVAAIAPKLPDIVAGLADSLYKGFVGMMNGAGEALETLIPSAISAIVKFIITFLENSDEVYTAGGAIVKGLIIGIIKAIPELIEAIPQIIVAICEAILEAIPDVLEATLELIGAIGDALIESGEKLAKDVEPAVEKIKDTFDFNLKDLPTMLAEYAGKGAAKFIDAMNSIGPLTNAALKVAVNGVAELSTSYKKAGDSIGKALANSMINSIDVLPGNMKTAATNIVNAWYDTTTPLPKRMETIMSNMKTLALSAVEELPDKCISYAKNVAYSWTDNLSSLPSKMGSLMKTMTDSMINNSKTLTPKMKQIISDTVDGMNEKLNGIGTTMGSKIKGMVDDMSNAASDLASTMGDKITTTVSSMKNAISGISSTMTSYITKMVTSMANEIANLPQKLKDGIDKAIQSMKDALTNGVQAMQQAGKDLIDGISKGINDKITTFKNSVVKTFQDVVGAFKRVFGIASPSKVMRQIGVYCVEGFEQGFETLDPQFMNKTVQASLSNINANIQGGMIAGTAGTTAGGVNYTQIVNVNREIATPDELARTLRIESKYGLMKGVAVG